MPLSPDKIEILKTELHTLQRMLYRINSEISNDIRNLEESIRLLNNSVISLQEVVKAGNGINAEKLMKQIEKLHELKDKTQTASIQLVQINLDEAEKLVTDYSRSFKTDNEASKMVSEIQAGLSHTITDFDLATDKGGILGLIVNLQDDLIEFSKIQENLINYLKSLDTDSDLSKEEIDSKLKQIIIKIQENQSNLFEKLDYKIEAIQDNLDSHNQFIAGINPVLQNIKSKFPSSTDENTSDPSPTTQVNKEQRSTFLPSTASIVQERQSTHDSDLDRSCSASIERIAQRYGELDFMQKAALTQNIKTQIKNSNVLSEQQKKTIINMIEDTIQKRYSSQYVANNISLEDAMFYVFKAATDSKKHNASQISDNLNHLFRMMNESATEYAGTDEGSLRWRNEFDRTHSCPIGIFHDLITAISTIDEDVNIVYPAKVMASITVQQSCIDYLENHPIPDQNYPDQVETWEHNLVETVKTALTLEADSRQKDGFKSLSAAEIDQIAEAAIYFDFDKHKAKKVKLL